MTAENWHGLLVRPPPPRLRKVRGGDGLKACGWIGLLCSFIHGGKSTDVLPFFDPRVSDINKLMCVCPCVCTCTPHDKATALCQRVNGIDRGGGLRALVALRLVFVFLHRVLADEWAVLVELSIATLPVVHQTVVALLHVSIQRRLAALQRLVVLITAVEDKFKYLTLKFMNTWSKKILRTPSDNTSTLNQRRWKI